MEFEELWRIFRGALDANKWMILLLCLSSTVTGVVLAYSIPEKYKATALVLVRPQEMIGLSPGQSSAKEVLELPASGSTMQVETPSKTYIEVIKSRAVAERIVRSLNLGQDEKEAAGETLVSWLKSRVRELVYAAWDVVRYGRVIELSPFESAVRELMKNISLTAIRDTFVFQIAYLSGNPEEAAAVANEAAKVFVEYRSLDSEKDAKGNREFIERQMEETERELDEARRDLQVFKERHDTASFEEERTEMIKAIATFEVWLEETEVELSGLLEEFTPSNPKVAMLEGKKARLEKTIAQDREKLRELPEHEAELANLELHVRSLENTYETIRKEFEEARLRESRTESEIRVASPATVPTYPEKPIKGYYGGIAFVLALFTGVGLALLRELTDTRLRTIDDVERALDVPVLATTPTWRSS
jgi:uncharacterized protein involved in exopolysaccharide biosynthesis